jgi:hypothetical protein
MTSMRTWIINLIKIQFIRILLVFVFSWLKEKEIDNTKEELKVEIKDEMSSEENLNLSQVEESPSDLHKEERSNLKKSKRKSEKGKTGSSNCCSEWAST